MIPQTTAPPRAGPRVGPLDSTSGYLLKLLAGPAVFVLILALPLGLSYQGRVTLATFGCAATWWITQPVPWAVASMLPFLVFPAFGVKNIGDTMQLYGQPIFFWIMGTVLMGYAIEKHGLAQRIALGFLALPGVGSRAIRLTFTYMLMVGVVAVFISDAATVGLMIPIGMSIARHVGGTQPGAARQYRRCLPGIRSGWNPWPGWPNARTCSVFFSVCSRCCLTRARCWMTSRTAAARCRG